MKIINFLIICALALTDYIQNCDGQRTKDKMYDYINVFSPCFRRMNGTHQTGCSSQWGGSTGVVHFVERLDELDVVLGTSNGLDYMPVIPADLLAPPLLRELQNASWISGVVVYERNLSMTSYSHEDVCPNSGSDLPGTCADGTKWNINGTGLLQADIRIPVFYVDQADDIEKIRECHLKFNNHSYETHPQHQLCSLELQGFMFASLNTPTCLRRSKSMLNVNPVKFCDPLGDQNVWGSLFPVGNSTLDPSKTVKDGAKYVVVAARMDATSLFLDMVPGADNPITGIVTLLTTAQLLKRMMPEHENFGKNVLFIFFHGESYDYIGSERIVYDMKQNMFPGEYLKTNTETIPNIKLEDIELFVEISQVSRTKQLHAYTLREEGEARNFYTILKKHSKRLNLADLKTDSLPPASLQSFYRGRRNISGIVIADHGDTYENHFYNSMYDRAENINYTYVNASDSADYESPPGSVQEHVEDLANALARSLYEEVTGQEYTGDKNASGFLANELFHCYLTNANCLVHQAIQSEKFKEEPFGFYVSVPSNSNVLTSLIGLTLAWVTGTEISNTTCKWNMPPSHVYRHFNMSPSMDNVTERRCYRTSMNFTDALSPAFIIDDYDWSSGRYSSWSESVWQTLSVRLYLKPSKSHEVMTIVVGSVTFALSIVAVWLINRKAQIVFEAEDVSPANC